MNGYSDSSSVLLKIKMHIDLSYMLRLLGLY